MSKPKLTQEEQREITRKKWDSLGFLEGLNGHVKENMAQLYESQASSLLTYNPPSGDTREKKTENE